MRIFSGIIPIQLPRPETIIFVSGLSLYSTYRSILHMRFAKKGLSFRITPSTQNLRLLLGSLRYTVISWETGRPKKYAIVEGRELIRNALNNNGNKNRHEIRNNINYGLDFLVDSHF